MERFASRNLFKIGVVLRDFRLGGSERVAIGLANYWSGLGFPVTVFAGRSEGEMRDLLCPEITVHSASIPTTVPDKHLGEKTARAAKRYFRTNPVQACYVPGNGHWPITRRLAQLPEQIRPTLVSQVSSPIFRQMRNPLSQWLYNLRMRFLLRASDHVVAVSHELARDTRTVLKDREVKVIPLPVVWEEHDLVPVPDNAALNILAAGRLVPVKGFDVLIKAIALVKKQCPTVRLTICGEGPERPRLESLISTLDLHDNVVLAGYVASIRPWLDMCRMFVLSSYAESYGAVLVEALAAGRQIVSTRCTPALQDLMQAPWIGEAVSVGDPYALAKAIIRLQAQPPPPCEKLAETVRTFHLAHGGQHYLSLLLSEPEGQNG
ncbi:MULTISPECIES: glycosyltransferase [Acetobacter]|uniref:glycosyltransferase n=1 Tax=Acetobacter TaxID=434 RepID=UPI00376F581C